MTNGHVCYTITAAAFTTERFYLFPFIVLCCFCCHCVSICFVALV